MESSPPMRNGLTEACDRNVREALPLVTGGMASLFLALGFVHVLVLRGALREVMAAMAFGSAAGLTALYWLCRSGRSCRRTSLRGSAPTNIGSAKCCSIC